MTNEIPEGTNGEFWTTMFVCLMMWIIKIFVWG